MAGWFSGWEVLASFRPGLIPMAPSAGLAMLGLTSVVLIELYWPGRRLGRNVGRTIGCLVTAWAFLVVGQVTAGEDWGLERWFQRGTVGVIPLGTMSPVTATLFVLLAGSVLAWQAADSAKRWAADAAVSLALGVGLVGFMVAGAYLLGHPLLYGGWVTPISLPSAVVFVSLSLSVLLAAQAGVQFRHGRFPVAWAPAGVILLAFALFALVERLERSNAQARFERRANLWSETMWRNMLGKLNEIEHAANLFTVREDVTRQHFHDFVSLILRGNRGIRALEWLPRVANSERENFEKTVQAEGFSQFQITEWNPDGKPVRSRTRAEYYPLLYLEPFKENEAVFGFDPSSEPTRWAGLAQSRDTGEKGASAPLTLIQDARRQMGVVVTLPVFRKGAPQANAAERQLALRGFLSGVFSVRELVSSSAPGLQRRGIIFTLRDITQSETSTLLYQSEQGVPALATGLRWGNTVNFAGRRWQLEFQATAAYLKEERPVQAWAVLGIGLAVALGSGIYLFSAARHLLEIKRSSAERERLIAQLQTALAEVKSLKGLIPICASCKKIRDDKGYWGQIEQYIQEHSEAQFSHGLCPECAKKFFPDDEPNPEGPHPATR